MKVSGRLWKLMADCIERVRGRSVDESWRKASTIALSGIFHVRTSIICMEVK